MSFRLDFCPRSHNSFLVTEGWFCAPGRSHPGLSYPKLGGAEAEPHHSPGILRGAALGAGGQLPEPGPGSCSRLRGQRAGAWLLRFAGFRGDSAKTTLLRSLSDAQGAKQKHSTSFSPPSLAALPSRTLPKCLCAQDSSPGQPLKKLLPPHWGDYTSWAGCGGSSIWLGGNLELSEGRLRVW